MVAPDSEMASEGGEVESTLQLQPPENHHLHPHPNNNNNNGLSSSSLGRQSSIYSLTLDEFQHTLCESGRNFGSMNMDEFLTSIWTAEENQAHVPVTHNFVMGHHANNNNNNIPRLQPSLARQGSLSLPEPLCRKTVDEVWAEIRKNQQQPPACSSGCDGKFHNNTNNLNNNNLVATATVAASSNTTSTHQRQVTFGEMTLEDFLVRAGVVREQAEIPAPPTTSLHHHQQHQYSIYQNNNNNDNTIVNPTTYVAGRSMMGFGGSGGGGVAVPAPYQTLPQQPPPLSAVYGGRMGNGSGSGGTLYGHVVDVVGSPASPDGLCANNNQGGDGGNHYGLEEAGGMRGGGGRKRITDGPVEVVVERRQRRMIKNRESAARSRARKQAYTVELEAELNQLKEENSNLKRALAEMEKKRKEEERVEVVMKSTSYRNAAEKMRRTMSCAALLLS